jgi:hypothetical protein
MTPVFADTAFYVAILNPRDSLHTTAVRLSQTNRAPVRTTEFILLEVANFFTRPGERETLVRLMDALAADPNTQVLPARQTCSAWDTLCSPSGRTRSGRSRTARRSRS